MKLASILALILLAIVLPASAFAQVSDVDWVRGTDFSQFHTFTWATGAYPIQDPDANLGMARAVLNELESKGVQYVEPRDKFDVFVTYNARISPDPQNSSRKSVTITVRIFDSRNNKVVWRAGGNLALVNDNDENRRNIRDLLAAIFEKYPPE